MAKTPAKPAEKKAAAKPAVKKAAPAAKKAEAGAKKPNAAFMKPVQPSDDLAAIIGNKPLPRTEVTKKIWEYIKKHDLQDPNKRTDIIADEKLKPIFGGKKKVTMFEMTKLISAHLS
jgi:chromatin remodeling complex protein RSC6